MSSRLQSLLALGALVLLPASLAAQTPNSWRFLGASGDALGSSLAAGPDINGDGIGDVLVGLPTHDAGATLEGGRVRVLSGADLETVLIEVDGDVDFGRFGQSVAWLGDLDSDEIADFAVGAPGQFANSPAAEALVSIRSGADGSEIRRLTAGPERIYDGDFESSASALDDPWTADGSAERNSSTTVAGMPVSGSSFLRLTTIGSFSALPPNNPGGISSLPSGANSVTQEVRISDTSSVLRATIVMSSLEVGNLDPENDFVSVDVSADGVNRNVLVLDTNASFPATADGVSATLPVDVDIDLAEAFPSADSSTVFTVSFSAGNLADGSIESELFVDNVRLEAADTNPGVGSATSEGGWFGWSVANVGDMDGDGLAELAVGAPGERPTDTDAGSGSAFVFTGADGELLLQHDGGANDSQFGSSVSAGGTVDDDEVPDWIVGSGGPDAVGGFVLSGSDGSIIDSFSSGTAASVSQGADIDGDGRPDWVSGESDNNQLRLLDNDGDPLFAPPFDPTIAGPTAGNLGAAVEIVGDLDGDGILDFVAGSPASDGGLITAFSGRTSRELFTVEGDDLGGSLGATLASAGDRNLDGLVDLLVGDPSANSSAGAFHVIHGGNPWYAAPGLRLDMQHGGSEPHIVSITAGAGEALTLGVKAVKKSDMVPRLRILGPLPDLTEVLSAEDSIQSPKSAVAKLTLPNGGDYRIEILDDSSVGGRYAFTSRSKPAKVKELIDFGGADMDLPVGRLKGQGVLGTSETHRSGFTARRGTALTARVKVPKAAVMVPGIRVFAINGADEELLFESAATTDKTTGFKKLELPADGQYALEVYSQVVTGGSYDVLLSAKLPKDKRKLTTIEGSVP